MALPATRLSISARGGSSHDAFLPKQDSARHSLSVRRKGASRIWRWLCHPYSAGLPVRDRLLSATDRARRKRLAAWNGCVDVDYRFHCTALRPANAVSGRSEERRVG